MRRQLSWALVGLTAALPFAAGPAFAHGLDGASVSVRTLASAGLWAGWALTLLAALVPHPATLTVLRVLAPAGLAVAIVTSVADRVSVPALASTAVVTLLAFATQIGMRGVNGPAYGNERRYPLRAPGALLVGPGALAWAFAVGGIIAGPLLLAAQQWVAGAIATISGVPLSVLLLRSLHGLSRRWVVFVPAGIVVHDPISLADPVLFLRQRIAFLGPASADSDGVDLTQRAPGLAVELQLKETTAIMLSQPGTRVGASVDVGRLLITPTRPGAVLEEASSRGFGLTRSR